MARKANTSKYLFSAIIVGLIVPSYGSIIDVILDWIFPKPPEFQTKDKNINNMFVRPEGSPSTTCPAIYKVIRTNPYAPPQQPPRYKKVENIVLINGKWEEPRQAWKSFQSQRQVDCQGS